MIIGIDHGYYAIKTRNFSFPAGITPFGDREPYTRQNVLTFGGCFFVCGSGRQPIQRDKTANDNYYLLTLAAFAVVIQGFESVLTTLAHKDEAAGSSDHDQQDERSHVHDDAGGGWKHPWCW